MRWIRSRPVLAMVWGSTVIALAIASGRVPRSVSGSPRGLPAPIEARIELGPLREQRSPLGVFPPTEVIDEERRQALGVRRVSPAALPPGLLVETRLAPDGAYITQIGDVLFLTQRELTARPGAWTLRVPPATQGALRVTAATVEGWAALGIERPGEFARLEWTDGRHSFVFFDMSGAWGINRLIELAHRLE